MFFLSSKNLNATRLPRGNADFCFFKKMLLFTNRSSRNPKNSLFETIFPSNFDVLGSLGASWGLLGPLGPNLGGYGSPWVIFDRFWSPKRCPKGGILGAKMEPKSIPKRGRNLRAKKLPLVALLGRSWADLGASWDRPRPQNRAVVHTGLVFLKIHFLSTNASQEPSWTQLGATWEPKGSQKAPQKGTQDDQKRVPKTKQKT